MDKVEIKSLEQYSVPQFVNIVEAELQKKFGEHLHQNYGRTHPWSLLSLIESGEIDTYQLIYVNGIFWGGTGGIVREYQGETIYQAGFRVFTSTRKVHSGIGSRSYIHECGTAHQITRAVTHGCTQVILSFNDYNEKFYRLTRDYHLPRLWPQGTWIHYPNMKIFNGVPQWLLVMYL